MKYFVSLGLLVGLSFFASASQVDQFGIVRNADGTIFEMTQRQALSACPAGMHLPTIRELVLEAVSLGSWLLEEKDVEVGKDPFSYDRYSVTNPDGTTDAFWYSFLGYYNGRKFPDNDLTKNWFWSSSLDLERPDLALDFRGFFGRLGYGFADRAEELRAVRCFADH